MLTAEELRDRVRSGLSTGRLWRLAQDQARLHGAAESGSPCHVCDLPIARGQAYALARASVGVLVHLECYLFWLHASGLFGPEPILCVSCRRVIPRHAEKTVVVDEHYHGRCRDRATDLVQDATGVARLALTPRARGIAARS